MVQDLAGSEGGRRNFRRQGCGSGGSDSFGRARGLVVVSSGGGCGSSNSSSSGGGGGGDTLAAWAHSES